MCRILQEKYYQLNINNNQIAQKQIWRSDCGLNHVYPQTGTWLYERANWCPGACGWPIYHDISGITSANTNFSLDINMQPYTDNGSAGYGFASQLISYSVANHVRNISVEDIVAPRVTRIISGTTSIAPIPSSRSEIQELPLQHRLFSVMV